MRQKTLVRSWGVTLGAVVLVLTGFTATQAQEHDEHATHEFHANHLAVAIGGMTPLSETSQTSLALGADYERRIDPRWGVGGGLDFTVGDHKRTALLAVAGSYRPVGALRLSTGPGFELVEKDKSSGGTSNKSFFLWTVGAYYEFHMGAWAVGPQVLVDFVGETKTNLTYTISIGRGF